MTGRCAPRARAAPRVLRGGVPARRRPDERCLISQNCRGLKSASRLTELAAVLRARHAFAACLQETWRTGRERMTEGGYRFFGMGPDVQRGRGSQGVAIALSPAAIAAWEAAGSHVFDGYGSRVIAVSLSVKDAVSRKQLDVLLVSA